MSNIEYTQKQSLTYLNQNNKRTISSCLTLPKEETTLELTDALHWTYQEHSQKLQLTGIRIDLFKPYYFIACLTKGAYPSQASHYAPTSRYHQT